MLLTFPYTDFDIAIDIHTVNIKIFSYWLYNKEWERVVYLLLLFKNRKDYNKVKKSGKQTAVNVLFTLKWEHLFSKPYTIWTFVGWF